MAGEIEIEVGDVTDMEARLVARFAGEPGAVLVGRIRGPFCEGVRTLPAEFEFRAIPAEAAGVAIAEAVVTDPCMWSAELPHLYHVELEARVGERRAGEYRGTIGLRRLAPRRPVDFAPGTG